jgi:hypothetical protein
MLVSKITESIKSLQLPVAFRLADGSVFDTSLTRRKPFEFILVKIIAVKMKIQYATVRFDFSL